MTNSIFRQKALDRWENEGGRIYAAQPEINKMDSPDEYENKENAGQISEGLKADAAPGKRKQVFAVI